jgi:hypothetical protein
MATLPLLGVLAGAIGLADTLPYVRDTLRGVTRPHRGTWLIWSVLAVVACLSQHADGASWSLVLTASQAAFTGYVFLLAVRHGEGGLSAFELAMMGVACAGLAGWLLADRPVVAVACVIAADLGAAAMMTPKAYRDPYSETLATYGLASVAGACAAAAVGALDVSLLLYPVYYCLANGALALLIFVRRRQTFSVTTVSPSAGTEALWGTPPGMIASSPADSGRGSPSTTKSTVPPEATNVTWSSGCAWVSHSHPGS